MRCFSGLIQRQKESDRDRQREKYRRIERDNRILGIEKHGIPTYI